MDLISKDDFVVVVQFYSLGKLSAFYTFFSNKDVASSLRKGYCYKIESKGFEYMNPVIIKDIYPACSSAAIQEVRRLNQKFIYVKPITKATLFDSISAGLALPIIKNVYFNEKKGTTVVVWDDGTKTKVVCNKEDTYDKEKGLVLCMVKKYNGNTGKFNDILKKWIKEGQVQ